MLITVEWTVIRAFRVWVFQTAGSNATEVNQNIDELLEEVRKDLPERSGTDADREFETTSCSLLSMRW